MTTFAALLAAVTITFPPAGTKMPGLDRCYMSGAVMRGVTNLVVQGRPVEIYKTGGWVTMLDLVEGTNTIEIVAGAETTNHVFTVDRKPLPVKGSGESFAQVAEKKYAKIPYAKDVARPHPSGRQPSEIRIVLDAGHGGKDPGTKSPHGFCEKEANLRVVREVSKALQEKGYQVIQTRDDDTFIELFDRPKAAHTNDADAFVSIHHNAPGFSTDPRTVRYHTVYSWNPLGERLAKAINEQMALALEGDIPSEGTKHANFVVTRNPEIPSCLVEVDFMTTPQAEEAVFDHFRRRAIGKAIAEGIDNWCKAPAAE